MSNDEPKSIYILDDNEDLRTMISTLLRVKGYSSQACKSSSDLYACLAVRLPHALLLDMRLGDRDGRTLCTALKSDVQYAEVPVIMFTAQNDARQSCLEAGADYFIEKPFEMGDLLKILEEATA